MRECMKEHVLAETAGDRNNAGDVNADDEQLLGFGFWWASTLLGLASLGLWAAHSILGFLKSFAHLNFAQLICFPYKINKIKLKLNIFKLKIFKLIS